MSQYDFNAIQIDCHLCRVHLDLYLYYFLCCSMIFQTVFIEIGCHLWQQDLDGSKQRLILTINNDEVSRTGTSPESVRRFKSKRNFINRSNKVQFMVIQAIQCIFCKFDCQENQNKMTIGGNLWLQLLVQHEVTGEQATFSTCPCINCTKCKFQQ